MKIRGYFKTRSVVDQWSVQFRGFVIVWNNKAGCSCPELLVSQQLGFEVNKQSQIYHNPYPSSRMCMTS